MNNPGRRHRGKPTELPPHIRAQWPPEELERRENLKRLEVPLAETELSVRTVNTLEDAGMLTIAQLVERPLATVIATANFGAKTLVEVRNMLRTRGIFPAGWDVEQNKKRVRPSRSRSKKK